MLAVGGLLSRDLRSGFINFSDFDVDLVYIDADFLLYILVSGKQRELDLEEKVKQLKSMGFDEVCSHRSSFHYTTLLVLWHRKSSDFHVRLGQEWQTGSVNFKQNYDSYTENSTWMTENKTLEGFTFCLQVLVLKCPDQRLIHVLPCSITDQLVHVSCSTKVE